MRIRSIITSSRPDMVAKKLASVITGGEFSVNELLPPERLLAKRFGVSRNALREAVAKLEARGLVSVEHGHGTVVTSRISEPVSRALVDSLAGRGRGEVKLLEARRILEVSAVRLAVERATAGDLASIGRSVEEFERSLADIDRCAELDLEFHRLMVAASHNEILSLMLNSIAALLLEGRKEALRRSGARLALDHHRDIYSSLTERNADKAVGQIENHLNSTSRLMKGQGI